MNSRIALTVPQDHAFIAMVREMGRTLLAHHAASAQDIDDLEAVVGELCANVTRHGRSEGGCYSVTLEHLGDRVVLTVADQGRGFDPDQVPAVGSARMDEDGSGRHGGYGLHLVDSLVDTLEFRISEPSGTTVRAEKQMRVGDTREGTDCAG